MVGKFPLRTLKIFKNFSESLPSDQRKSFFDSSVYEQACNFMLWELNWLKQRWTLSLDLFHSCCLAKPLARNKTILMFQWLPTLPWLIFNACENMISDGCLPQIAFISASKASESQKEVNKLFKVLFSLSYLKFCPKSMVWTSDKLVPFWFVLALSKMSTWV